MAGVDEGDDIGANVVQAHAAPGFRIERTEQQRQQIRGRGRARVDQAFARGNDVVDRAREKRERFAPAQPSEPREEFRRAEEIQRVQPADRVEIGRDRTLKLARATRQPLAEQRLLEHLERRPPHLLGDFDQPAVPSDADPFDEGAGDAVHRGREIGDLAR